MNGIGERASDHLRRCFGETAGGEEGLLHAVGETLAAFASERLDAHALAELEDALVDEVQAVRGRSERDPLGLVLTPEPVAQALGALLAVEFPAESARCALVLDPACGTARLLRGTLAVQQALGSHATQGLAAVDCVGWDIDPVVLTIAQGLATLRGRQSSRAGFALQQTDGLAHARPAGEGEMAIVCNPPFVAAYARRSQAATLDSARVAAASGAWSSGRLNLAVAFVARSVRDLLRPGELAGFVLPDTLLSSPRYALLRSSLLSHVDGLAVGRLPETAFPTRGVRAVLVVCRRAERPALDPKPDAPRVGRIAFRTWSEGWSEPEFLAASLVASSPAHIIPWPSPSTELAFGLANSGHRLDAFFSVSDGVNPGGAEARAALVRTTPRGLSEPRPLVEGRDIQPGELGVPEKWIETDPGRIESRWRREGTSLRRPALFDGPRLYSRQTADRIVSAYASDDSLALNSVHVIRWDGREEDAPKQLQRLSAILSTEVFTEVYRALFAEDRRLFPQVKITNLRSLPVPWPPPEDVCRAADRWSEAPSEARLRLVDELVVRWLEQARAVAPTRS